jgi:quinol monooxygenase YgiN
MSFVQTISFTTSRMDEMQKLMDDFGEESLADRAANHGFVRNQVLKDRDRENAFVVVAEFATYEQAMANSARPETDAFAKKMAELTDGPPTFGNYDVISEETP